MNNVNQVCSDCARKENTKCSEFTMWYDIGFCDLCKESKEVSNIRSWVWPRNHPLSLRSQDDTVTY